SAGTVSKVCERMEADLVIERSRNKLPAAPLSTPRQPGESPEPTQVKKPPLSRQLRLLQPEKLLDLLADNYTPPEVSRTFRGKCVLTREELRTHLALRLNS